MRPFYGVSEISEELIGKWKFVGANCEDNKALTKKELAQIKHIVSLGYTRHFQADGILIDSLNLKAPTKRNKVTCSVKHTVPYTVSGQTLSWLKDNSVFNVDCEGDNQKIESRLKTEFKEKAKSRSQEFKRHDYKLLLYSLSSHEKTHGFNCAPKVRLVEKFELSLNPKDLIKNLATTN